MIDQQALRQDSTGAKKRLDQIMLIKECHDFRITLSGSFQGFLFFNKTKYDTHDKVLIEFFQTLATQQLWQVKHILEKQQMGALWC